MTAAVVTAGTAIGRVRFSIVAMLFAVTIVNYADRATIAIAGPVLSWHRSPMEATPAVPHPPTSLRVGHTGSLPDFVNPTTGRRESGHDWRVLDPPPVDQAHQVTVLTHLSRHSGYPASADYPAAVAHVRPL